MLAQQGRAPRAQRQADARLAPARLVFNQPQTGEIGRGNGQNQQHDPRKNVAGRGFGLDLRAGERENGRRASRLVGETRGFALPQHLVHVETGGFKGHAGLQADQGLVLRILGIRR